MVMAQTSKTRYFFTTNNDLHAEDAEKIHDPWMIRRQSRWVVRDIRQTDDLTVEDCDALMEMERSFLARGVILDALFTKKRQLQFQTTRTGHARNAAIPADDDEFWIKKAEELGVDITFSDPMLADRLVAAMGGIVSHRTAAAETVTQ